MTDLSKFKVYVYKLEPNKRGMKPVDGLVFDGHAELFENIEDLLGEHYPHPKDRVNLFYTANLWRGPNRAAMTQCFNTSIWFDVDYTHPDKTQGYIDCFGAIMAPDSFACVKTGMGLQFLILKNKFNWADGTADFFKKTKSDYLKKCEKLREQFAQLGLIKRAGPADSNETVIDAVWDRARVLRLPFTTNSKMRKLKVLEGGAYIEKSRLVEVPATLVRGDLAEHSEPDDFLKVESTSTLVQVTHEKERDDGCDTSFVQGKPLSFDSLKENCGAFNSVAQSKGKTDYNKWYRALRLAAYTEKPLENAKAISDGDTRYKVQEVERKVKETQKKGLKPWSCKGMAEVFSECETCPHRADISSPTEFVKTTPEDERMASLLKTNFHEKEGKKWVFKIQPVTRYIVKTAQLAEDGRIFYLNKNLWHGEKNGARIGSGVKAIAKTLLTGKVNKAGLRKTCEALNNHTYASVLSEWEIDTATMARINWEAVKSNRSLLFKNGVYDLEAQKFTPLADVPAIKNWYFRHQHPFDYIEDQKDLDPKAYDLMSGFLLDVFGPDLTNFLRWASLVFNPERNRQSSKALVLIGPADCGKSTVGGLIQRLLSRDEQSSVNIEQLHSEFALANFAGSKFNYQDETSTKAFGYLGDNTNTAKTERFKTLVTGGTLSASHKGRPRFRFEPRAALMFCANETFNMPDRTGGTTRRLLPMFLQKTNPPVLSPYQIKREIFTPACMQVFTHIIIKENMALQKSLKEDKPIYDENRLRINLIKLTDENKETIDLFLEENVTSFQLGNETFVSTKVIYEHYTQYIAINEIKQKLSLIGFSRKVKTGLEKLVYKKVEDPARSGKIISQMFRKTEKCNGYQHILWAWENPPLSVVKAPTSTESDYTAPRGPYKDD